MTNLRHRLRFVFVFIATATFCLNAFSQVQAKLIKDAKALYEHRSMNAPFQYDLTCADGVAGAYKGYLAVNEVRRTNNNVVFRYLLRMPKESDQFVDVIDVQRHPDLIELNKYVGMPYCQSRKGNDNKIIIAFSLIQPFVSEKESGNEYHVMCMNGHEAGFLGASGVGYPVEYIFPPENHQSRMTKNLSFDTKLEDLDTQIGKLFCEGKMVSLKPK